MKRKGVVVEWGGITFWTLIFTIIVLGVLVVIFYYNLIPGAKEWLLSKLGVG